MIQNQPRNYPYCKGSIQQGGNQLYISSKVRVFWGKFTSVTLPLSYLLAKILSVFSFWIHLGFKYNFEY